MLAVQCNEAAYIVGLEVAAAAEAVVTLETQEDVEEQEDAALPEHQQHLTAYQ